MINLWVSEIQSMAGIIYGYTPYREPYDENLEIKEYTLVNLC